ncbi:MAG: CBS domain-containing protein, partial [Anaerolineae bacterium]
QVIDHHEPRHQHEGWTYKLDEVGATTTMLLEMAAKTGWNLSPEEATLLLLGVYEDTGSLTYGTTTARDARAAAFLLEQGARLDVVRRFLNVALTPMQQALFADLQTAVTWQTIKGHNIAITTASAPDNFDDEISSVAHRLRDALATTALFVLVQLKEDVQLVARSASHHVDVSQVARALGGGGHNRAAAAMVVGQTLTAVLSQLEAALPQSIKPMLSVSQIMSYGVQTLAPDMTVEQAAALMRRHGHEGYPVFDSKHGRLVGLLTRRAVDRAMSHELSHLPISRIMRAGSVTVRPSDSVERVQQLMMDENWGQIPVLADGVESGQPIGVVTRTDVLNALFNPLQDNAEPDMRQMMTDAFPPALWGMLLAVSETAASLNMPLYLVGGPVRDLMLDKRPADLDMVAEGNAIELGRRLRQEFGGNVHTHARFGTAKWFVTPEMWQGFAADSQQGDIDFPLPTAVDFVTARSEFYTRPSALPEVSQGSIKLDLHRRDFTINTLAVRLDGSYLGELLDFYGGQRDLEKGIIRVLHSLSFIDDPTRILRAVRLEQRLGFRIDQRTAELMATALPMLDRVTGDRIRHEIELAFHEARPSRMLRRLAELGVMAQIHPALVWSDEIAASFARMPALAEHPVWGDLMPLAERPFFYFALWLLPLSAGEQAAVMNRLKVRKSTREDVLAIKRLWANLADLPPDPSPSQVEKALRPSSSRALLIARIALDGQRQAGWFDAYFTNWRHVKTAVTGDDLRALGLKPGPRFAVLLDRLLAARLDREVTDEAGERALLEKLLNG